MLTAYILIGMLTFIGLAITVPVLDKLDRKDAETDWGENLLYSFLAGMIWPASLVGVIIFIVNRSLSNTTFEPGKWLDEVLIDKIVAAVKR